MVTVVLVRTNIKLFLKAVLYIFSSRRICPAIKGFDLFYPPVAGSVNPEARLTGTRISGSRLYDDSKNCN